MARQTPDPDAVEELSELLDRTWADGVSHEYRTLTLRKIEWHHRDHREFAVLHRDVLVEVVDLERWIDEADGDVEEAASKLAYKLDEIVDFEPKNGKEWRQHWERVRECADLVE